MNTGMRFTFSLTAIVALMVVFSPLAWASGANSHVAGNAQPAKPAQLNGSDPENSMLQFRAGNHIVGFTQNKAYFASANHALSVGFLGTKGVMPKADSGITPDKTAAKALPLTKVFYQNLWEGINLTYTAAKDGITESIYYVAPGSDVTKIRLKYNVPVSVQMDGTLRFKFDKGYLTESAPIAWQDIEGKRVPVKVAFNVAKGEVGFKVGKYDPRHPLTIDPTYAWHTFYGQSGNDYGKSIAVDGSGSIYITGYSSASWTGPITAPHPDPIHAHSGSNDIFVLKLDSSGAYKWHTFYGSTGSETDPSIAADRSGNVYVAGSSIYGWQGDGNTSPKHAAAGGGWSNFFLLKLDSSGVYQWHTFYGGSTNNSTATSIALDSGGNAHVAGYCSGTWFGSLGEGPVRSYINGGGYDICILKLTSAGDYVWHTFYGSTMTDVANDIATDSNSNVYVTGYGLGEWTGMPAITPINAFNGVNYDMFVLKLNSSGAYQWHTFHGSSNNDYGNAIAVDNSSNVYVTGSSVSSWGSNIITAHSGNSDRYLLKLNSSGAYQWNTFWAGGSGDSVGIALDKNFNIYVTGYDFLTWGTSPLHGHTSGDYDITVAKFDTGGARMWNTFYGAASSEDKGAGIAVDGNGSVIVTGSSAATWQGEGATPDPLHAYNAGKDITVLKLALTTCPGSEAHVVSPSYYGSTIGNAYNNAQDGSIIQLQAVTFEEDELLMDSGDNIRVTLRGGYECDFLSNPGFSILHGKMTISKGKVTIDSLIIR
jgi:hypothetical protein